MQGLVSDGAREFLVRVDFSAEKRWSVSLASRSLGEPLAEGGAKRLRDLPFNRKRNQLVTSACKSPDVILGRPGSPSGPPW
jgi:hypothetical protein